MSIQAGTLERTIVWVVFLRVSFLSSAPKKKTDFSFYLMETFRLHYPAIFTSLGNRIRVTLDRYIAHFLFIMI